jgi:hypothetical protein
MLTFDTSLLPTGLQRRGISGDIAPKEMIADYFTKPLQGTLFKQLRNQIMNIDIANPLSTTAGQDYRSVLEVVVGRPRADDGWTLVQAKLGMQGWLPMGTQIA